MSALQWALAGLLEINAATFAAMAWDKFQAQRGGRRVPEFRLHLLEFLGGWPASLGAMQILRHKRQKPAFWGVTLASVVFWALLAWLWLRLR